MNEQRQRQSWTSLGTFSMAVEDLEEGKIAVATANPRFQTLDVVVVGTLSSCLSIFLYFVVYSFESPCCLDLMHWTSLLYIHLLVRAL